MDKVYKITKSGKRVLRDSSLSVEELSVLQYLADNKSASTSQLELVGERWIVKSLHRRKLIKELTE